VPRPQVEEVDDLVENGLYANRSEFVRTAIREKLYDCPDADDAVAEVLPPERRHGTRLPGGDD